MNLSRNRVPPQHVTIVLSFTDRILHGRLARLGPETLNRSGREAPIRIIDLNVRHAEQHAGDLPQFTEVAENDGEFGTGGVLAVEVLTVLVTWAVGACQESAHGKLGDWCIGWSEAIGVLGRQLLECVAESVAGAGHVFGYGILRLARERDADGQYGALGDSANDGFTNDVDDKWGHLDEIDVAGSMSKKRYERNQDFAALLDRSIPFYNPAKFRPRNI